MAAGAAASVGAAALVVGCGDDDDEEAPPAGGSPQPTSSAGGSTPAAAATGNLNIAIDALPPTLDPSRTSGGGYFPYNWDVFDGLLTRDNDANIIPGLASSYEYNEDFTELSLKLRSDVTFHNGDPFTSEDVAFTLERQRTPDFKMAYAPNFARITKVSTPDANTVVFKSKEPFPELHQYLDSYFYVVPKKYATQAGERFTTEPVGTGPYKVTRFATGDNIEFQAYENYWGSTPGTAKVVLKALPEASTRVAALQAREVDLIWGIAPQFFDQIRGDRQLALEFTPAARVQFIMMNLRGQGNSAYQDVRVREAMNIAINREQIGKVVYGGASVAGGWFSPKGTVGYRDESPYAYDPEKAKSLLAEAGFANGLEIDAISYAAPAELMYNGVIADWQAVGIRSKSDPLGANFVDVLRSHAAPMIATTSQNVSYDGASDLIRWLRSDGGYSISDGQLDDAIDEAAATGGDKRPSALESVFETVYKEYLVIPIVENSNVYAYRTDRIKEWPQILGWPYPRNYGAIVKA